MVRKAISGRVRERDRSMKGFERVIAVPRFRRLDFSSIWAPSAIRSRAVRRNFVCDPRAVASCAITSICIRIPGLSSTSSILPPRPLPPYLTGLFFASFSLFFSFLFPRPTLSAVPVGYVSPLFPFLSSSRPRLFCLHLALSDTRELPRTSRWFLLNPLVLYSNWFELSRPTSTSARLCRVVLSTAHLVALSLIKGDPLTGNYYFVRP